MARILLVEDNDDVREVLCQALEGAGHETECVGSLGEARAVLRTRPVDAVVTDVRLPDGKGYELMSAAQAAHIPVILVTGHFEEAQGRETPGVLRLMKPFPLDRLVAEVERVIDGGERAS